MRGTLADGPSMESGPVGAPALYEVPSAYRYYIFCILTLSYTLNSLDRQVINILAEPIKHEFALKDWQLGVLTGLAFAALYSVLAVPIARIADRGNRPLVLSLSMAVWCLFTAVCGVVQNFTQLVLARLMVGVGEAGGPPAGLSLVADYTPLEKRGSATALYIAGVPLGTLLGLVLGGLVADAHGWRIAFFVAGAPGLVLAAMTILTVKEPRQRSASPVTKIPDLATALKEIGSKRSFVLLTVGSVFANFVTYAQFAFVPSFLFRVHGAGLAALASSFDRFANLGLGQAGILGLLLGLSSGGGGIVGTLAGGWLTDRAIKRDYRHFVTLQVVLQLVRIPIFFIALVVPNTSLALLILTANSIVVAMAYPAAFGCIQGLVQPRSRATAYAVFLLCLNLGGLGLGPLGLGVLSDILAGAGLGPGEGLRWSLILGASIMGILGTAVIASARRTFMADTVS